MEDFLKDDSPEQLPEPVAQAPEPETGEVSAPPAEPQREEPEDARRKGLEAAVLAERRKRQQLEEQLAQFQQQQQPQKQEAAPPDPNAYQDNPQEYWRLLARYEARQELQSAIKEQQQQAQATAAQRQQQERARRVNDVVTKGQLKYADFDPVINTGLAPFLTPQLHEKLATSEAGHDVAYWLGKNPIEANRVAQLTGDDLVRALTRIEDRLTAPQKPSIPTTLTTARDARGQFQAPQSGLTSLHDILGIKPD